MKKVIVTTTINAPTLALIKYSKMEGWDLIVVGDLKTPSEAFYGDWHYLTPEYQKMEYPELSEAIGWNCIMRRNIGFIEAYKMGADIVASVDDDNIPYDSWGKDIVIGKRTAVSSFNSKLNVIDPMKMTNHPYLWHRGYPIDRLYDAYDVKKTQDTYVTPLFQAGLWDGDPDVDALCRLMYKPKGLRVELISHYPVTSANFMPFNSQNTFIAREALPYYMVLPHIGRSDDIWGGYIAQYLLATRPVFTRATVYQERNEQSIYKNLEDELFGYRHTSQLLDAVGNFRSYLPEDTLYAFDLYGDAYANL
jgi:hypothetical protein